MAATKSIDTTGGGFTVTEPTQSLDEKGAQIATARSWSFSSLEAAAKQRAEFEAFLTPAQKLELDKAAAAAAVKV